MSNITKKAIAMSLKKIMQNKPLDKITVKEITADCGVNRQTFYYHFTDIFKLIEWIFKEEAIENISEYKSYATWQKGFLMIFEYVKVNLKFCTNCFNSAGRDYLERFLYSATFDLLYGVVTEVAGDRNIKDEDLGFIANFYTYAFIGIMASWIRNKANEDPSKIINDINRLIEGDIYKAIKNNS